MINKSITADSTGKSSLSSKTASVSTSQTTASSSSNGLAGIEKGQVIRGEVIDLRSNEVSVKLEDGRVLTGKLLDNTALSIGSKVVFSVEEVSAKTLVLKIVPGMKQAAYNTVDKALDAAGLSKTDRNKDIVKELLNQQMPIDKNTISLILKQALQFKDVSIDTLVFMHKNNLPVTEANLDFLNGIKNSENKLVEHIHTLSDTLSEVFQHAITDNNFSQVASGFLDKLLYSSPNLPTASPITGQFSNSEVSEFLNYLETAPELKAVIPKELLLSLKNGTTSHKDFKLILELFGKNVDTNSLPKEYQQLKIVQAFAESLENAPPSSKVKERADEINQNFQTSQTVSQTSESSQPDKNLSFLLNNLYALTKEPLPASLANGILSGESSGKEVLQYIKETLETLPSHFQTPDTAALTETAVKELLTSKEFKSLLKDELLTKWSLSPEAFKEPDALNQHFESLLRQLQDVRTFAEQNSLGTSSTVHNQVSNLQENVHFMNSLNNVFTYVQLPLKLQNQYSGGELYVYTRKKAERDSRDGVSVLLHLDMKHLGPLDIFLDLQKNQLTSKFYLESTEIKELVSSNINELEDKLIKNGYFLKTEFLTREKSVAIMEEFLSGEADLKVKLPSNFDIRA